MRWVRCCVCAGKSTLAQQLASRLNMPNVLQTDAICEASPYCLLLRKPHHVISPNHFHVHCWAGSAGS
jgi:cytidylate kinase